MAAEKRLKEEAVEWIVLRLSNYTRQHLGSTIIPARRTKPDVYAAQNGYANAIMEIEVDVEGSRDVPDGQVQVQFGPECSLAASQLQPVRRHDRFPGSPPTMPNAIDRSRALLKCRPQIELSGGMHVIYWRVEPRDVDRDLNPSSNEKQRGTDPSRLEYKDNRAYPWPGGESHFILYPESANQTIYTQEMRASDAGRYSCQARNDTTTLEGDITLSVLDEESGVYTGKPLPTYKPSSQLVPLGGSARIFCEAYLGKVDLPDAKNSVTWSRCDSNVTLPNHGRIAQQRVSRENDQIIGSYLGIQDVTLEDYGKYKCEISNGVDEEITLTAHVYRPDPQFVLSLPNGSWRKSLLLAVLVLVLLLSAGAFYARCWLPLALFCRDKFGHLEESDGKECDALVCYHEKDSSLVIGIVIPTLESRHRYKCAALELSQLNHNWSLEISPHANTARRVIVVLSPASLDNIWTDASVGAVLKQLSSLPTRTIVVTLKRLPSTTATIAKRSRRDRRDADSISFDRLTILSWQDGGGGGGGGGSDGGNGTAPGSCGRKFWYKLRLAMPAMRPVASETGCQSVAMIVQANGKCGQQKARSRESLEVLV
ncbi:PREDICTED: interleukin-1 receptor accessory protein-like 1 [Vollenhovia emeryi]|uniref:interleukin-1 receptor accessory protein-like 1 n=1 Tax=Vollenhovia emeryi TaxID=411798 RepID=UPI0005F506B1|nr:PREDICTED: interleukin-1 receptor accessory protein-like 1 [Vollenhovia emeryi]